MNIYAAILEAQQSQTSACAVHSHSRRRLRAAPFHLEDAGLCRWPLHRHHRRRRDGASRHRAGQTDRAHRPGASRGLPPRRSRPRAIRGCAAVHVEIFVEPINPPPQVIIVGAGHVGRAMAYLAKWLGFRVIVNDDRAELRLARLDPRRRCVPARPDRRAARSGPHRFTDLRSAAHARRAVRCGDPAAVVGHRRGLHRRDRLPAPLDNRPRTVARAGRARRKTGPHPRADRSGTQRRNAEEIAVSILAEIILLRNGGTGEANENDQ